MTAANDFRLGEWKVSPSSNRLIRVGGAEIRLEPKPMLVLVRLAGARGAVVTRQEILDAVWPGEFVTEHVLSRCIFVLRRALEDDPSAPRYIETIRKRGYRLVAPVEDAVGPAPEAAPHGPSEGHRLRRPWLRWSSIAAGAVLASILGWALGPARSQRSQETPLFVPLTAFRGSELDPVLSPDGNTLAFSWSGEGHENYDIYVKPVASQELRRLTAHPGEEKNPAWSPNGNTIAFVRSAGDESGIYTVPSRGGEPRRLVTTASGDIPDLVWSRDGRWLYFADRLSAGAPSGIFGLDLDSLTRYRVTDPGNGMSGDRDLAVSPDGRWIAFARAITPDVEDLWVGRSDGDDLRLLSRMGQSINGIEWSADGRAVIFSSPEDGVSRLWIVGREGDGLRSLPEMGEGIFDPSLSMTGEQMVFERKTYDTNLWRLDLDGSAPPAPQFISTRWESLPAIAPDGSTVAFISDRTGHAAVWEVDVPLPPATDPVPPHLSLGSPPPVPGRILLPPARADQRERSHWLVAGAPRWSADGGALVFALRHGKGSSIHRARADGTEIVRLTQPEAADVDPVFSTDGTSIVFASNRAGLWQIFRIAARPPGAPVQLTLRGGIKPRLSPDGQHVLFLRPDRGEVWTVPLDGGEESLLFESDHLSPLSSWDVSSSAAFFTTTSENAGGERRIMRFDLQRRSLSPVSSPLRGLHIPNLGISVAPNERWLLFGRVDSDDGDIVLAERMPSLQPER